MHIESKKTRSLDKLARRLSWQRILVPIDFSKTSLRALDVAVPLACDYGARLLLLSVIEPDPYATGMESVITAAPADTLVEDAKANLPRIAERFIPPSVKFTTLVRRGSAFVMITQAARQKAVDLIVLTTHGRTGLEHVLMGSTAERVVRHAHCPVFVVRSSGVWQKKPQVKE